MIDLKDNKYFTKTLKRRKFDKKNNDLISIILRYTIQKTISIVGYANTLYIV